jgi:acyl-CoA thioester hydrolase
MTDTPRAPFERMFHARWGDMDFNGHLRNTAYLDMGADVRMMYFVAHGFPMREFERLKVGPVIRSDELTYYKELRLLDPIRATLLLAGLSADGARFRFRNEFFRGDGRLAARLDSSGGWLDLVERRLVAPPAELLAIIDDAPRSDDFEELR